MCSDVNRLRNSDLVVKQIYNFSWQNVSSKVRNAGKLIPFVFKTVRVNMLLKIRKRKGQLAFLVKPTTASEFGE